MRVLFVGGVLSSKYQNSLMPKDRNTKLVQQHFDTAIFQSLSAYTELWALSLPPIPTFPISKTLIKLGQHDKIGQSSIYTISIVNLPFIKQIWTSIAIFIRTFFWVIKNLSKKKRIILSSVQPFTGIPLLIIKFLFRVHITVIVPDIPKFYAFARWKKNLVMNLFINFSKSVSTFIQSRFSSYILLTEDMNQIVNTRNKPHLIMEGIINEDLFTNVQSNAMITSKKIILYAGVVDKKYGLEELVWGVIESSKADIELWLYGEGDFVNDVLELSFLFPKIVYKGLTSRQEILALELGAYLLVNPRPKDAVFSPYSFPSKLIEYMLSGTPVLTSRLSSIPNEYYEFVDTIDEVNRENIRKYLDNLSEPDYQSLLEKAKRGQKFIRENKGLKFQGKRIADFITEREG